MLRLFDFSEERAFAAELVLQIQEQLPSTALSVESVGNLSVNKITRLLERIYQEAGKRLKGKRMGVVRRSVFANAFKWGLSEKGYPGNFIDIATEGLIMELMKARK